MGMTKILTDEQKTVILKTYIDEKRGQLYCSKKAKCSIYMVKKFLKEQNIKIRNYSEATIESNKNRAKRVNHNYFKNENHNMAWLLGYLAADGCISGNSIIINISTVDKEILEKIRKEVEIEREIKDRINLKGFPVSRLEWTSEEQVRDLSKYNIIPRKTYNLKPPYLLDKRYHIDYIRGYFDGDGSINLIKNSNGRGNGNLRWQVGGTQKEVINFIADTFEEYGIPKTSLQVQYFNKQSLPFYSIQYSSVSTRKIYNILYTDNGLYLKRKKDHYEEIMKKVKPLNEIKFQEATIPFVKE